MPKMRGFKPEMWTDEKFVELTPLARLLFMGMWNWACDNGHVENKPRQFKLRILPADDCTIRDLIAEMLEQGMVVDVDTHLVIPALPDHQRIDKRYFTPCEHCTPDEIPPEMLAHRAHRSQGARGTHDGQTPGDRRVPAQKGKEGKGNDGETNPAADAPEPESPREDVTRLCEYLADRIERNGVKRPTVGKSWLTAARLMLDRDGYTEPQIRWLIEKAQEDEFWRSNILSMPTLRTQADRLKLRFGAGTQAKTRHLRPAHELEQPPDGLSEEEYAAWERERREARQA